MSELTDRLRKQFGPFWDKGIAGDGLEMNNTGCKVLKEMGLEAADRIEALEAALQEILEIPVDGHGVRYKHGGVEMAPYWKPREIAARALGELPENE